MILPRQLIDEQAGFHDTDSIDRIVVSSPDARPALVTGVVIAR
jgi:hypothetical protein